MNPCTYFEDYFGEYIEENRMEGTYYYFGSFGSTIPVHAGFQESSSSRQASPQILSDLLEGYSHTFTVWYLVLVWCTMRVWVVHEALYFYTMCKSLSVMSYSHADAFAVLMLILFHTMPQCDILEGRVEVDIITLLLLFWRRYAQE